MKSICRTVAFSLTLLMAVALDAEEAPSIIEPKVERSQGPPLWISAKSVADEEKIIDLDLIDSLALRVEVERQRKSLRGFDIDKSRKDEGFTIGTIPLAECTSMLDSTDFGHRGGTGSTATLAALAANSGSILRGTIRTIDWGFDGGVPASLLGVEVSEVVKGPTRLKHFYVLYPVARFRIGPLRFCNANKGFEPQPGDEILLFDFTGPVDRNETLFGPRFDQIVFERQPGALVLPPQLKSSTSLEEVRELDEIVKRLRFEMGSSLQHRGGAL